MNSIFTLVYDDRSVSQHSAIFVASQAVPPDPSVLRFSHLSGRFEWLFKRPLFISHQGRILAIESLIPDGVRLAFGGSPITDDVACATMGWNTFPPAR